MLNLSNKKILLTGGYGFLGSHVFEELLNQGAQKKNISRHRSKELDLRLSKNARRALKGTDIVIHLAGNVGGIGYNRLFPGTLFYDNAIMGLNLIEESRRAGVEKFVQIGTVCSYPKVPPQIPFIEEHLWHGYPEETNAPYGIAKLTLLEMLQAYRRQYGFNGIYLLPVNLYGPRDNFHPDSAHVIPDQIRKLFEAKEKNTDHVVWGTGSASREFLYVEDAARAIVLALKKYEKPEPVNIGSSNEISIKELVNKLSKLIGYKGKVLWDASKPDGQPRRKLDITKARKEFGFVPKVNFDAGLRKTIRWYKTNRELIRRLR